MKIRTFYYLLSTMLLLQASGIVAVQAKEPSLDTISIDNSLVSVVFDLGTGRYSLTEKSTGTILLREATFSLGAWDMSNAGQVSRRIADIIPVSDELGTGQTLRVTAQIGNKDRPVKYELECSLTLYESNSALILGGGIRNLVKGAILVKGFTPMLNAELWPCDAERANAQTLDGHGAYGLARERMNDSKVPGHAVYGRGNNAVLPGFLRKSENNLLLTYLNAGVRRNFVSGGLTYYDFFKRVEVSDTVKGKLLATAEAYDPVGRMVDAGSLYRIKDRFYIDLLASDPFSALENYAQTAVRAQRAAPDLYNFPTLCTWYVMQTSGDKRRHTAMAVEQMDLVNKSGFLRYSPVAIRLVPDTYQNNTEQGWWDDAHWQKYGYYTEPYETSKKYCDAIRERGGIPFTYVQTGMPSDDFARAHPEWMLNNSIKYLPLARRHQRPYVRFDYSDMGFQEHMRKVWGNLEKAGMGGLMFDYPETGFAGEGGLENPYSTAAAAYRKIFELAREGLGPQTCLHERNLGETSTSTSLPNQRIPFSDVTLGLADSQRLENDASSFTAAQVFRAALRWYKARVFYMYDMDAKSLLFRGLDQRTEKIANPVIQRRAILTMLYVTGCRILMADSYKDLSPDIIHDLSRLYPMHEERRTARPVDLLLPSAEECPRIYQFAVRPDWQQVTFFNPNMEHAAIVSTPLSGDAASEGALGLEPDAEYYVFDFWNNQLVGRFQGSATLSQELESGEARMFSVRKTASHPQVLSSDRHLMQGFVELSDVKWETKTGILSGKADLVAGEPLRITLANNGLIPASSDSDSAVAKLEKVKGDANLTVLVIEHPDGGNESWRVTFQ